MLIDAMDRKTRVIVGVYVGDSEAQPTPWDRSKQGARGLWNSLPSVSRQSAVFYTDFSRSYENVIPENRHRAVGKEE
jgi:IS1 family transposase